jgi:hypothetical protein
MVSNSLEIAGNWLVGDKVAMNKDISDLWDATKGTAFGAVKIASPVLGVFVGTVEHKVRPNQAWWN